MADSSVFETISGCVKTRVRLSDEVTIVEQELPLHCYMITSNSAGQQHCTADLASGRQVGVKRDSFTKKSTGNSRVMSISTFQRIRNTLVERFGKAIAEFFYQGSGVNVQSLNDESLRAVLFPHCCADKIPLFLVPLVCWAMPAWMLSCKTRESFATMVAQCKERIRTFGLSTTFVFRTDTFFNTISTHPFLWETENQEPQTLSFQESSSFVGSFPHTEDDEDIQLPPTLSIDDPMEFDESTKQCNNQMLERVVLTMIRTKRYSAKVKCKRLMTSGRHYLTLLSAVPHEPFHIEVVEQ